MAPTVRIPFFCNTLVKPPIPKVAKPGYNAVPHLYRLHDISCPQLQYQYKAQILLIGSGQNFKQDGPSSVTTRKDESSKSRWRSGM